MSQNRKLQEEITRTLKKVTEGIELFDEIWEKVHSAPNQAQKEKFEAELKKEIKKLQRLRDNIKGWQSSSDIKDKSGLVEARKQIENKMEQFRYCEKETKTKAYSIQGLAKMPKQDPEAAAKYNTETWIVQSLEELKKQLETLEADIEASNKRGGKKKAADQRLEEIVTRHRHHIRYLECILRMVDNDILPPYQVDDVQPGVELYLASYQDSDYEEDQGLYDMLIDEAALESHEAGEEDSGSEASSQKADLPTTPQMVALTGPAVPPLVADKAKLPKAEKKKPPAAIPTPSPTVAPTPVATTPPPAIASPASPPAAKPAAVVAAPAVAAPPQPKPKAAKAAAPPAPTPVVKAAPAQPAKPAASPKPAPAAPTAPTPQPAAQPRPAAGAASPTSQPAPAKPAPAATTPTAPAQAPAAVAAAPAAKQQSRAAASPPQPINDQALKNMVEDKSGNTSPSTSRLSSWAARAAGQTSPPSQPQPTPKQAFPPEPLGEELLGSTGLDDDDEDNDETFGDTGPVGMGTLEELSAQTAKLQRELTSESSGSPPAPRPSYAQAASHGAELHPQPVSSPPPEALAGAIPASPPPSSPLTPSGDTQGRTSALNMLEASLKTLPKAHDCERRKPYTPPNPHPTPPYYPQAPHPVFDTPEIFSKFDTDTLYFIFYYQQATYQQYLAAKELKKQSWRYHKKYMTWFQRHDQPKVTTDEYEQGTYVYFDYETGWCQRLKHEFTFKYAYLEDELPL